jgi:hypothetical protein
MAERPPSKRNAPLAVLFRPADDRVLLVGRRIRVRVVRVHVAVVSIERRPRRTLGADDAGLLEALRRPDLLSSGGKRRRAKEKVSAVKTRRTDKSEFWVGVR